MKKILIATTALVATAGFATAEVKVGGTAMAGLKYNNEAPTTTILYSKVNINFSASGETDGGIAFGFDTNHIVENNGDLANDDTTVYISGAFGKLSFGAVSEADMVAGLNDIGWDGLDVDDIAETFAGDNIGELGDSVGAAIVDEFAAILQPFFVGDVYITGVTHPTSAHNVNYTYANGPLSFSISGLLATSGKDTGSQNSAAVGVKYNFGDAYVGLGYADHSAKGIASAWETVGITNSLGDDATPNDDNFIGSSAYKTSVRTASVYGGGTFGAVKVAAMYSDVKVKISTAAFGGDTISGKAYGVNASYNMDALTVSAGASAAELAGFKATAFGVGAAYDLGGGATVSGGVSRVKDEFSGENAYATKETRADFGVTFKF